MPLFKAISFVSKSTLNASLKYLFVNKNIHYYHFNSSRSSTVIYDIITVTKAPG